MNKQELIKEIKDLKHHVKNILARLRELLLHNREVWLKAIMGEFEQDFSCAKWREGYEQGKLEGEWVGQLLEDADKIRQELNKPVIPQFVADWYEEHKDNLEYNIWDWMKYNLEPQKRENVIFSQWLGKTVNNPVETLIKMKLYGYEIEQEEAVSGEVFNSPLFKVEEVEE